MVLAGSRDGPAAYGDSDRSTNFGRLQGDVGRQAWALWPGMEGGYGGKGGGGGGAGFSRAELARMSKAELVELAVGLQGAVAAATEEEGGKIRR